MRDAPRMKREQTERNRARQIIKKEGQDAGSGGEERKKRGQDLVAANGGV